LISVPPRGVDEKLLLRVQVGSVQVVVSVHDGAILGGGELAEGR
jgi:hypothetical protein